jgi:hypothetical protein
MPDLFLSYCRDDRIFKNVLRDNLRRLGFNVWIDEERLWVSEEDWMDAIEQAIELVDAMVVILSPQAKQSKWVKREIVRAQKLGKPVFPVLAAGDDLTAVPISLETAQFADMRGRADYEAGFRALVSSLAARFKMTVTEFSLDFCGEPRVQVSVHGHNEGNIVVVGGGMSGALTVAGRDVVQGEAVAAPPREASDRLPHVDEEPAPARSVEALESPDRRRISPRPEPRPGDARLEWLRSPQGEPAPPSSPAWVKGRQGPPGNEEELDWLRTPLDGAAAPEPPHSTDSSG